MPTRDDYLGVYRHYRGGLYQLIEICEHADTNVTYVIYKSLDNGQVWTLPYGDFFKTIAENTARFVRLDEYPDIPAAHPGTAWEATASDPAYDALQSIYKFPVGVDSEDPAKYVLAAGGPLASRPTYHGPSLEMQSGWAKTVGVNGFAIEDLIDIAANRICYYDNLVPNKFNKWALRNLMAAKHNLMIRQYQRTMEGSMGTKQPDPQ